MAEYDPKGVGMYFEPVRNKLLNYKSAKVNPWFRKSIINQARLAEGEGAAEELNREFSRTQDGRSSFSGTYNRQIGFGDGERCTDDSSFKKVGDGKFRKVYK